ncbi:MAG: DNA topoisomerase IV, partial [Actinobacteria bacterium]|nr:DNA topoisomerase IV [Actinomycetota bacterium]
IVDIDDVIAIIRSSDDAGAASARLMEVFDLSEVQANYILDMQLRRLTKFSSLDLESERDELARRIEELVAIVDDPHRLAQVVSDELDQVAQTFGTPRRTVLLSGSGATMSATASAQPLVVPDGPCRVMLSSTGLLARLDGENPPGTGGHRVAHDVVTSSVRTTTHGDVGLLTSLGRVIRIAAIDLPGVPQLASAPNLQGGSPVAELVALEAGERVLALTRLDGETGVWAVGTERGVVKRVNPEIIGKDSWDVIRLEPGDQVVGAVELTSESAELVFVTSDASLLHFPATAVRPQGRSGGGIAGVNLAKGAKVVFFGAVPLDDSEVVTVAGSSSALPGTDAGSVKVTALSEYPSKGRATGGVRCHRFLKGEDILQKAWVGPAPAVAAAASGSPITLPTPDSRRDGSGTPAVQPIDGIGTRSIA